MSLMKSDRTKAPKSDRIAGYAITHWAPVLMSTNYADHLAIEDAASAEQRGAV